eukprot:1138539-Pelagomonas_calceolata.AAC.2
MATTSMGRPPHTCPKLTRAARAKWRSPSLLLWPPTPPGSLALQVRAGAAVVSDLLLVKRPCRCVLVLQR